MSPEGRTLHCSSCGAPFPADSRFCNHCGSEVTLEERRLDSLCIHCGARAASDANFCMTCGGALQHQRTELKPDDGPCPRCRAAMRERDLPDVTVVECSSCGGLWLSPAVFDKVCGDAEISARTTRELSEGGAPRQTIDAGKVTYLPCPRCKDRMVRKNFGGSSGVILDVCRNDGIWLDHGELEKVVTFVRAGGLIDARRREVKRLEDEAREAKLKRDYATGSPGSGLDFGELRMPVLPGGSGIFRLLCDMLFSSR